VIAYVI